MLYNILFEYIVIVIILYMRCNRLSSSRKVILENITHCVNYNVDQIPSQLILDQNCTFVVNIQNDKCLQSHCYTTGTTDGSKTIVKLRNTLIDDSLATQQLSQTLELLLEHQIACKQGGLKFNIFNIDKIKIWFSEPTIESRTKFF